jgi:hypothetical protein
MSNEVPKPKLTQDLTFFASLVRAEVDEDMDAQGNLVSKISDALPSPHPRPEG